MDKNLTTGFLVFLWMLLSLSAPATATSLYAYDQTTPVFENPERGQPPLHTLTYGDQVTITNDAQTRNGWLKGKIETEAACIAGYMRTETLLPIPAPDLSISGFQSLTNRLEEIGTTTDVQADEVTTRTQKYQHGVTLNTRIFHTSYGDFDEQSLLVSGITVAQGFLLARAIVNQDGISSEQMKRIPDIEKDEQGHLFVLDESHWQIISVKQTQDGVVILFPERAD